jgi:glycosyltransferase involved in cell wall biosynthesis
VRLLFCIKTLTISGGAERVLSDIANGLARRGHEVAVLSFDAAGVEPFYALDDAIERLAVPIGPNTRRATLAATLKRLPAIRAAVRRYEPDVAIGFMHSMFIPLGLALVGTRVPVVGSEHTIPELYDQRPLEKALLHLLPFLVDRITCVSLEARKKYPPAVQAKMELVPNPVTFRVTNRVELPVADGPHTVLAVGRLVPRKDHETLIRAFGIIASSFPKWRVRIAGDGEERERLGALVDTLGLGGRVELLGAVADIGKEYAAADIFVVPSRYESFGLVTVEALVSGLPVVGFADCPGTNELIEDDVTGVLVSPSDDRIRALAESLSRLMSDTRLRERLGTARGDVGTRFGLEPVLERWTELLAPYGKGTEGAR